MNKKKRIYILLLLLISIGCAARMLYGLQLFPNDAGKGDLAERIPLSVGALLPERKPSAGDVVAIDDDGFIQKSMNPYSPYVVGIVSTNPAHTLRNMIKESVPVALSGIVPCHVTDENGLIGPGDLLVSSSKPGYAMKSGKDVIPGTIVGKALGSQEQHEDMILVIIMLA